MPTTVIDPEELELRINTFLSNLEKTQKQRLRIEYGTLKRETSRSTLVQTLLYKQYLSNVKAISLLRHGVANEANALNQLSIQLGIAIQNCGLFVHAQTPYLGATPYGLIGNDKVVEIKCPLSVYKQNLNDVDVLNKLPFFKKKDDALVQGQLLIARSKSWSGKNNPLHIETIDLCENDTKKEKEF